MRWSWKIGTLAGIEVKVHVTFFLLLAWIALLHWRRESTLAAATLGVIFVCALFGCVVLHELGHALTARRFGRPRAVRKWTDPNTSSGTTNNSPTPRCVRNMH